MCQAAVTPRRYPEGVGIFRDLCALVRAIVHPGLDDPSDEVTNPGNWALADDDYEDDEGEEFDVDNYDALVDGWWTCAICGFDANDHNMCMGCGHPLTPDTYNRS